MTEPGDHPLVAAVKPLADAMGAEILVPDQAREDDVVLAWEGVDVLAVRLPQLSDSLDHILAALERRRRGAALGTGPQDETGSGTDTGGARRLLRTPWRGDGGGCPRGQPLHRLQLHQLPRREASC